MDPSVISLDEVALITSNLPANPSANIQAFAKQVIECDFKTFFLSSNVQNLLTSASAKSGDDQSTSQSTKPLKSIFDSLAIFNDTLGGYEDQLLKLTIGIAMLHAFIQTNWTGPNLDFTPSQILKLQQTSEDDINSISISELTLNGEPVYHLAQCTSFLLLAVKIFNLPFTAISTSVWWKLRAARIHREMMDEPAALPESLVAQVETLISTLSTHTPSSDFSDPKSPTSLKIPVVAPELKDVVSEFPGAETADIIARLHIEKALMHHLLAQNKQAADDFVKAARCMGLEYEITGIKGRRTKFQTVEYAQLTLLAKSRDRKNEQVDSTPETVGEEAKATTTMTPRESTSATTNTTEVNTADGIDKVADTMPETLDLNDDTLLEKTEYTSTKRLDSTSSLSSIDPNNQPPLHPLDQTVLLGLCLHIKNSSPSHGLTTEQMSPYVSRVISHPRNWSVHTMSLLLRSRLEAHRTRTVERSTLQLQALIDQMPTSDSTPNERLKYIHQLALPSKWAMEKELAIRLMSLGVLKSALEILERLEMWAEVVECWQALEKPEKGREIVKDLLEGRKKEADAVHRHGEKNIGKMDRAREAKLWCLLGEVEPSNAESHFRNAWEISNHTSGRAMRSLGGYYFARERYAEAAECLKEAVKIQPLLSRSWFILGCSLVRMDLPTELLDEKEEKKERARWREARDAFARCVMIDEEDAESWNNLATAYLRLGAEDDDERSSEKTDEPDKSEPKSTFANKVLAHRALQQGLKNSYSNWRMWSNYMVVSIEVGELSEATRALGRLVEERADKDGEDAVDFEVLERLVNAVTRSTAEDKQAIGSEGENAVPHSNLNPNEGAGLYPRVDDLFRNIILTRFSNSPRIWRARAQLLTWKAQHKRFKTTVTNGVRNVGGSGDDKPWTAALEAYTAAYRSGVVADTRVEVDLERWREAVGEVEEFVDVLRNFGPKAAEEVKTNDGKKKRDGSWNFQAKSVVRTFMGRTRDSFEDEPEWQRLVDLSEELKN